MFICRNISVPVNMNNMKINLTMSIMCSLFVLHKVLSSRMMPIPCSNVSIPAGAYFV